MAQLSHEEIRRMEDLAEENKQMIDLYDNLAVYSDYLMNLLKNDEVQIVSKDNSGSNNSSQHLVGKGSSNSLNLIKKSNDIKGIFLVMLDEFNNASYYFYKVEDELKPTAVQIKIPQGPVMELTDEVKVDFTENPFIDNKELESTAAVLSKFKINPVLHNLKSRGSSSTVQNGVETMRSIKSESFEVRVTQIEMGETKRRKN